MPQLAINGQPFTYNLPTPALTYAESSQAQTSQLSGMLYGSGMQITSQWPSGDAMGSWMMNAPLVQQGVTFMPGPPPLGSTCQNSIQPPNFTPWNEFEAYEGVQQQYLSGSGLVYGMDTLQPAMLVQQMHDDLEGMDYSQPAVDFMGADLFGAESAMADYQRAMGQVIGRDTFAL